MPALIDLWLMPTRLWLDLVAPLKVAPLATDVVPLGKARCIRRKRKMLRSKRGDDPRQVWAAFADAFESGLRRKVSS
jgi:hypothetical protein